MRPEPALAVSGLSFSYGTREILRSVDFSLASGEMAGLFGPNGSGKTTLFRCLLGILKPALGEIRINGRLVNQLSPVERARLAAYVPQDFRPAFGCTVRELVAMGRTPHMGGRQRLGAEDRRKVDQALERTGLTSLATSSCTSLSGGQRQLAAIARALAQDARVVLLDEPTSALDFRNAALVWELVRSLGTKGIAVLVCVHDPNHILWHCPRVLVMNQGKLLADGPSREALGETVLEKLYGPGLESCPHCGSVRRQVASPGEAV